MGPQRQPHPLWRGDRADDSVASVQTAVLAAPRSYTYAPFGGVISDGCTSYTYDGFDRLTLNQGIASALCPAPTTSSFTYDGLDRQRTHIDPADSVGTTSMQAAAVGDPDPSATSFVHYDRFSSTIIAETQPGGRLAYALDSEGQAIGVRRTRVGTSATVHLLAGDGFGTTTIATTTTQGVACGARFGPFGDPVTAVSAANPCATGSTPNEVFWRGARRDAASGNYQFGSRTYTPETGRFLTPDTYRSEQPDADLSVGTDPLTANRYSYVNGDPVNLVDPDGHSSEFAAGRRTKGSTKRQANGSPGSGAQWRIEENVQRPNVSHLIEQRRLFTQLPSHIRDQQIGPAVNGLIEVPGDFTCESVNGELRCHGQWERAAWGFVGNPATGKLERSYHWWVFAEGAVQAISFGLLAAGPGSAAGASRGLAGGSIPVRGASTAPTMARPWSFARTEALSGNAASALKVGEIAESMRLSGWQGPPIKTVEVEGRLYIVDGHHRVAAAKRVGIDVPYEVVDPASIIGPGQWRSLDDVVTDADLVGPDRLRR